MEYPLNRYMYDCSNCINIKQNMAYVHTYLYAISRLVCRIWYLHIIVVEWKRTYAILG